MKRWRANTPWHYPPHHRRHCITVAQRRTGPCEACLEMKAAAWLIITAVQNQTLTARLGSAHTPLYHYSGLFAASFVLACRLCTLWKMGQYSFIVKTTKKYIMEQIEYSNRAAPVYVWHNIFTGITVKSWPPHYSHYWRIMQFRQPELKRLEPSIFSHSSNSRSRLGRSVSQLSRASSGVWSLQRWQKHRYSLL